MSYARGEDRYEIEQLLYRYSWMADERKWELMDTVFGPGGTIDYTSTGGQKGPYRPTLEWLHRALAGWATELSPGRVKHQRLKVLRVEGCHVDLHHLGGVEGSEVVTGHRGRDFVELKCCNLQAE